MADWVRSVGGGEITRLERHVARREAWVVDVARDDGSVLEGFLRLERDRHPSAPSPLAKETAIVEALGSTSIPVPVVHGWNPELTCTLFERDPGRSDIDKLDDPDQQRAVMEDFITVMARFHQLDLDDLGLDGVMDYRPTTAAECALTELDLLQSQWGHFLSTHRDPLITYAADWLRRNVPDSVARVSLVQGDTGPVNFMFQGDRVSSVIDWEWGHFGDPMEDLGNFCVREFWNPSGGLTGLFELYERESGIPYTRFAAQYYRVQQNVRGMIPIHYITVNAHPTESLAWYLCYRYVGDRATCESLADAMGVEVERPELPDEDSGDTDILAEAAIHAQRHDVVSALDDPFAASRASDVVTLIRQIDRTRRFGREVEAIEIDELGSLLGGRPSTLADGLGDLEARLARHELADEPVIRYLTRKSYRDEWLHAPAVELYPERFWADLD